MTFWVHALPKRLFVLWLRNTKFSKLFPNGHSFCQQRNTKFDFYYQFSLLSETWIWDILFRVLTFGKRNTYLWIPYFIHCMKIVRIRSYSDRHFPTFGLNTESISSYSVRMPENADQSNSEYGHFLDSDLYTMKNEIRNINEFWIYILTKMMMKYKL